MSMLLSSSTTSYGIAQRFAKLIGRAQLTSHDRNQFESHRSTVRRAIECRLDTSKVELMGSFARDTAIHGVSDVDLLVVLRKKSLLWGNQPKRSDTIPAEVREALRDRFASTTISAMGRRLWRNFDGAHRRYRSRLLRGSGNGTELPEVLHS